MDRCTICHTTLRTSDNGRTACWRCEQQLLGWLRELTLQLPLLQASLLRGDSPSEGRVGGATVGRSPLRDDVLNLLGTAAGSTATVHDPYGDQAGPVSIAAVLYGWATVIAQAYGCSAPALRPGGTWSAWLTAYLPSQMTEAWVPDMHAELQQLLATVRGVTRTEPRRRLRSAPCSCGAFGLVVADWQLYTECEACGHLYTETEYAEHRAAVMPRLHALAILMTARALNAAA